MAEPGAPTIENPRSAPRPIEERVLFKKPEEFDESLIWRRQKYAQLKRTNNPADKGERDVLGHEIQVITDRIKVLQADQSCPNQETVRERLAEIDQQLKGIDPKKGNKAIIAGLQIRRGVLEARSQYLYSNGPVISTIEAKKWKAVEQHNGRAFPPQQWEQLSPRLKEDPDAILDEQRELSWYIGTLSPQKQKEVRSLTEQMKPIDNLVRAVICMPAYREGGNIFKTLLNYAGQKEQNGKPFDYRKLRIVVFDNWPNGNKRDNTGTEVKRFMQEHPEVPIDYVKGMFDPKVAKIANIRNMITAAIIDNAAKNRTKPAGDLIYVSNDADIPANGVKSTYTADIIQEFDTHPRMDAMAGKIDFPEELMGEVPVQLATRRLWQYIDSVQMHKRNYEPFLVGRNSALRLKMVAAVGNYDPRDGAGEDVEIGNKVKWVRRWDKSKGRFDISRTRGGKAQSENRVRYVNKVSLDSDPRRDLVRLLGGERIQDQYSVFEGQEEVRGKSGEQLAKMAIAKGLGEFNRELFEKEAAAFYWDTHRWAQWGGTDAFSRAMHLLGAKFEVKEGKFKLTDTETLERRLQEHSFRYEYKSRYEQVLKTKIKDVRALRTGVNNQVYAIRTADGRNLVVRMSRQADRDKFSSEKRVMDLARKNKVPAPKVVTINTDMSIIPGWQFSISERIPGRPGVSEDVDKPTSDTLLFQAGRALRKLHEVKIKGGYGILNDKLEGYYPTWQEYVLKAFEGNTLQPFINKGLVSSADIQTAVKFAKSNSTLLQDISPQLLHGDFSLGNMMVENGRLSGLLDFENASSGDPLWDLAYFTNYTSESSIGINGMGALLNGYGKPGILSTRENWDKYNLYRLANVMRALQWHAGRGSSGEPVKWLGLQLKEAIRATNQLPPQPTAYSPITREISPIQSENREIISSKPLSNSERNKLLKDRFDGAVQWFSDFYEKGQATSDQELATGRTRYEEIRAQIDSALTGSAEAKKKLTETMRKDPDVSLSDKELKRQVDRLADAFKKDPTLFAEANLDNPAFRFLVYARNRGRIARYERSYSVLPKEADFKKIVSELARKQAQAGKTFAILDEGGTFDLGMEQLAERLADENPGIKLKLTSTSADNFGNMFADCHRFPVTHRMADVHRLTETFKGQKQNLIISEAAYKFFWDPMGAIRETANLLENNGWAFLGDIQENVSYNFDKLFLDKNGRPMDPVKVFDQLNKMNLGYTFYAAMKRTDSMGDDRRVLTLAIKKTTDKDLALPFTYGKRQKGSTESAWISPIVYNMPTAA